MEDKAELLRIAAQLKEVADRLIDCCKEDCDEDEKEDEKSGKPNHALMGIMLAKKMKSY